MREFFLTIMHSWGSDTPQEVFWALNDMVNWLKTKGFKSEVDYFEDPIEYSDSPRQRMINSDNDKLIKDISEFIEKKL
jgi:hypothetical protein